MLDTGEWEVVYNLRIADYHTYFVTDWEWGFSVWSHNACVSFERVTSSSQAGMELARRAFAYRQEQVRRNDLPGPERNRWRNGEKNIAVVHVSAAPTLREFVSRDQLHSEEWMVTLRNSARIPGTGGHVISVLSEREPCSTQQGAHNCQQQLVGWLGPQTEPARVTVFYLIDYGQSAADLLGRYSSLQITL